MVTQPPQWPENVEVVEVTPLSLKPGDTLVVRPKHGAIDVGQALRVKEFFEYFFPDNQIAALTEPFALDVLRNSEDPAPTDER